MPPLHLLPLGDVPEWLVRRLSQPLAAEFGRPVVLDAPEPILPQWRCDDGHRCDAELILAALVARPPEDGGWRLALVGEDLGAPGVAYAFGLSTIGGCCGLVNLARLDPTFHGEAADPERFFRRALVESAHEVGHIAGLDHCPNLPCAMYYSEDLQHTDEKGAELCAACRERLGRGP